MVSLLVTKGTPVTLSQLLDFLTVQAFICADDVQLPESGSAPVAAAASLVAMAAV